MARRPRTATAPQASVTWRDGVQLSGTPIWCDARRRRDVCFVSSADRVGRTGHGQLIATPLTLALLGSTGGGHLGVPLHRRFTLGTVRLELIASGRGPGAAALFVDITGKTVLHAGAVRTSGAPSAGVDAAEVRACDAVVVSAPFGKPEHRFPPLADTIERTIEHVSHELAAGRRPVLLVDTALDGLEVAMCLARAGIALAGGRPIREAAHRAGDLAVEAMAMADARAARDAELRGISPADDKSVARDAESRGLTSVASRAGGPSADNPRPDHPRADADRRALQIASPGKDARAVIWLARDRVGLARAMTNVAHTTASLAATTERDTDHHFAWTNAAGRDELLAWIESTSAREVYVTGTCADDIATTLGARAKVIGPPHQMQLFEATP